MQTPPPKQRLTQKLHRLRLTTFACLAACLVCLTNPAQADLKALLERVPGDATIVVGFNGFRDEDPAFAGSKLASFLEDADGEKLAQPWLELVQWPMENFLKDGLPQDPAFAPVYEFIQQFYVGVPERPMVLYIGQPIVLPDDQNTPIPSYGVLIEYQDDAQKALFDAYAQAMKNNIPNAGAVTQAMQFIEEGNLRGLVFGGASNASLANSNRFKQGLAQAHGSAALPTFFVYGDMAKLNAQVDMFLIQNDPDTADMVQQTLQNLGLEGLGRCVYTAGFENTQWRSGVWLEAPAPRRGLLGFLDQQSQTLDPAVLNPTSPNSTWVHVSQLNAHETLQQAFGVISQMATQMGEDFSPVEILDQIDGIMQGIGFPEDYYLNLITGLGDTWTLYADPAFGPIGIAVVSELHDPKTVDDMLLATHQLMQQLAEQSGAPIRVSESALPNGAVAHTIQTPVNSLTWCVHQGFLIGTSTPQALATAIENMQPGAGTIADAPLFKQTMAEAGLDIEAGIPGGFMYADLKRSTLGTHQTLNMFANLLAPQMKEAMGVDIRKAIPSIGSLLNNTGPAVAHKHTDDTGYHSWSVQPFPLANMFSGESMVVAGRASAASTAIGVVLPAMQAARQAARRMQASQQIRAIHKAAFAYAENNQEKLPPDFQTLVDKQLIPGDLLISPRDPVQAPGHTSFLFFQPNQRALPNAFALFAIERPYMADLEQRATTQRSAQNGLMVCLMDGYAEVMPLGQVEALVLEQTGKTLGEWDAELLETDQRNARMRAASAAVRHIMQQAGMYSNEHGGLLPPHLQALVDGGWLPAEKLMAADDQRTTPKTPSYLYFTPNQPVDLQQHQTLVVLERPGVPNNRKLFAGYMDFHASALTLEEAEALVLEQTGKTLAEWDAASK